MSREKETVLGAKNYAQWKNAIGNLTTFRNLTLLNKDQRTQIREFINKLQDATTGVDTEVGKLNTENEELKKHKKYVEDAEAMRKMVAEQNLAIETAVAKFNSRPFGFPLLKLNGLFSDKDGETEEQKVEKRDYYKLAVHLEDDFLEL